MGRREADDAEFADFVTAHERRLRQAFTSIWGVDRGREVAIDALAYGWENWDRVHSMDNPVGYLFVVGRERANRHRRRREQPTADFVVPSASPPPWCEPALPGLIEGLSDRERQVVVLLHAFEWSLGEIAELLEVSKSTVQTYADRALSKLRSGLGVQA
jgi:DNA-directed RNA polymerase specialized sigma24 family protein